MEKVTGVGGIFFFARDPETLRAWYRDRLGVPVGEDGSAVFMWNDEHERKFDDGMTVWSAFPETSTYFVPSRARFMVNFRVRDLDAMLAQLRAAGCDVDAKVEDLSYGKFGWVMDPEGNRVELWEPKRE